MLVHLDGAILPLEQARISPQDRGFLFADGLYEVALAHRGRLLLWAEHERRMAAGLRAIRLPLDTAPLAGAGEELLRANGRLAGFAVLYVQVTRGAAPRAHGFPEPAVPPTVYMTVRAHRLHEDSFVEAGVAAARVPDPRWARCDVKSTALLANVLAQQQAHEAGAWEALFVRDGVTLEGSHTNLFVVRGGELWTYPACNYILEGVTRNVVLALARDLGVAIREGVEGLVDPAAADEVFLTGTTTEVLPVVRIDGRSVGSGAPGPLTRRLRAAYLARLDELATR